MLGIHHIKDSFSEEWIKYCDKNNIEYYLIDINSSDLLDEIHQKSISHILFHTNTKEYRNELIYKDLVQILESEGVKVFPDYNSFWHYDDKLKQKYLFEHLEVPHAKMNVLYSKDEASQWVDNSKNYPFVFKLKGGAGSRNVKLVKDKKHAKKLVDQMFGKGIYPVPHVLKDPFPKIQKHKKNKDWMATLLRAPKTLYRIFKKKKNSFLPRERGYFLVQEFYPNNEYDTRITIIGDKAFGFKRKVRPDDFRASGSGLIDYNDIDMEMIKIAFDAADKIGGASLAFDFIYDKNHSPKILEVSYCYVPEAITAIGGYWDRDLNYYERAIVPQHEIINNLLEK